VQVLSKAFGLIEVDERQKLSFASGFFGFEDQRDFVLVEAEQQPFYWIQSVDQENLAFMVVNPFLFRPDYELDIDDRELEAIGLKGPLSALIFAILTIPPEGGPVTANLQGPVVINRETRQGIQIILGDSRWTTKHDIMAELARSKGAPC
jgi:flagellar assembly factor FliW